MQDLKTAGGDGDGDERLPERIGDSETHRGRVLYLVIAGQGNGIDTGSPGEVQVSVVGVAALGGLAAIIIVGGKQLPMALVVNRFRPRGPRTAAGEQQEQQERELPGDRSPVTGW
jgi:hypothetical protein